jgi:hypothetical protein
MAKFNKSKKVNKNKFGNNLKNWLATNKSKTAGLTGMILLLLAAYSCKKDENCDYELNQYNIAQNNVTSDSIAFYNHKNNMPPIVLGLVHAYIDQMGLSVEEAYTAAINACVTNPSAPEELKQYGLTYQGLWEEYLEAIANEGKARNLLNECKKSL